MRPLQRKRVFGSFLFNLSFLLTQGFNLNLQEMLIGLLLLTSTWQQRGFRQSFRVQGIDLVET